MCGDIVVLWNASTAAYNANCVIVLKHTISALSYLALPAYPSNVDHARTSAGDGCITVLLFLVCVPVVRQCSTGV